MTATPSLEDEMLDWISRAGHIAAGRTWELKMNDTNANFRRCTAASPLHFASTRRQKRHIIADTHRLLRVIVGVWIFFRSRKVAPPRRLERPAVTSPDVI